MRGKLLLSTQVLTDTYDDVLNEMSSMGMNSGDRPITIDDLNRIIETPSQLDFVVDSINEQLLTTDYSTRDILTFETDAIREYSDVEDDVLGIAITEIAILRHLVPEEEGGELRVTELRSVPQGIMAIVDDESQSMHLARFE